MLIEDIALVPVRGYTHEVGNCPQGYDVYFKPMTNIGTISS